MKKESKEYTKSDLKKYLVIAVKEAIQEALKEIKLLNKVIAVQQNGWVS